MLDPITASNPNLERVPDGEPNPFACPDGWFRTKGCPKTRIADSARVSGSAMVCDSAMVYDSATVYGSAMVSGSVMVYESAMVSGSARVSGSKLKGHALYAWAVRWPLSFVSKSVVRIGCQEHPLAAWLARGENAIPWSKHCTPDERKAIVALIKALAAHEALGNTWAD